MLGGSNVPVRGCQTPLRGTICVPSAETVKVGLGRKNAVISCALDSSTFSFPASSVGLLVSKRSRTCSQVRDLTCASAPGRSSTSSMPLNQNVLRIMYSMAPTALLCCPECELTAYSGAQLCIQQGNSLQNK